MDVQADVVHVETVAQQVAEAVAADVVKAVQASERYLPAVASVAAKVLADLEALGTAAG